VQSLLHPELVRVLAADSARNGPHASRQQRRISIRRRRLPRWTARPRLAAARSRA
jgi:hypothetical protein